MYSSMSEKERAFASLPLWYAYWGYGTKDPVAVAPPAVSVFLPGFGIG